MGKQNFLHSQEGCTFSLATPHSLKLVLHENTLASRRIHMRGNPNPKNLQSVENPERILRSRNKENMDFPLFGTSSSQDLCDIAKSEWGTRAEILLTKSKSESDLKKVEVSPSRLESYLLDSLWLDLETSVKYKKVVPIF